MERIVALKKIGKLIGKNMRYRINPKAPTPEERAAAKAELGPAIAERNKLREQQTARYNAVLEADEEYQKIKAALKIAADRADQISWTSRTYKITVGTIVAGLLFSVKAEGDSWEDIIAKLSRKVSASE